MLTLGIDPGTAMTGFGLILEEDRDYKVIDFGCITTPKEETTETRLKLLYEEIFLLIKKSRPDCMAVEKLFFAKNTRTAIKVSQARGVILLAGAEAKIPIAEYTPLEVKMALTGYGRADKYQMQQMVKTLLKLKEIPKPDDAADALAIAICHLNSYKVKSLR